MQLKTSIYILITIIPVFLQSQSLTRFYQSETRLYGFLNQEGDTILSARYCFAESFSNGFAIVSLCEDGRAPSYTKTPALINEKGEIQFQLTRKFYFSYGAKMSDSHIPVINPNKKHGYFNLKGETSIPFQFFRAWSFGEGWAAVQYEEESQTYFIDAKGKKVLELPSGYKLLNQVSTRFSNGLVSVINKETNLMGFMNRKGELVIPCQFNQVGNFSEGKAYVASISNTYIYFTGKNRVGYVNMEGEWIFELPAKEANLPNGCYFFGGEFNNGIAEMCIVENDGDCMNSGCLWVNEKGEIVKQDWE